MVRRRIGRHRLATFLAVTFGWTWAWDATFHVLDLWSVVPVSVPRVWGPLLATVVVVWASEVSLRSWFGRALDWRHRPALYALAVLLPTAITEVQEVVRALGGGTLSYAPPVGLHLVGLFFLVNLVALGPTEELGWRGFLQPRLQERASVLSAGLIVGVLWWAWHLPLFVAGHPDFTLEFWSFLSYTTFVIGSAAVFGALANVTDGRVLPLMVLHASVNVGSLLDGSGGVLDGSPLVGLVVGSGLWWLIVLALVARYGRAMVPEPGFEASPSQRPAAERS